MPDAPDTPERCVRVLVSGRVQGVSFRYATQREAAALGARGWVRNLPDGRVEALFEGPTAVVDAALDFVRRGPPAARVTGVDVTPEALQGLTSFEIRA